MDSLLVSILVFSLIIYLIWKNKTFSYNIRFWITALFSLYLIVNIINGNIYNSLFVPEKNAESCSDNIRAYEFGREMATYSDLSGNISLEQAINSYSDGIGVNNPYSSKNPCVLAGFNDAKKGKESIYNKSGKSWTSF